MPADVVERVRARMLPLFRIFDFMAPIIREVEFQNPAVANAVADFVVSIGVSLSSVQQCVLIAFVSVCQTLIFCYRLVGGDRRQFYASLRHNDAWAFLAVLYACIERHPPAPANATAPFNFILANVEWLVEPLHLAREQTNFVDHLRIAGRLTPQVIDLQPRQLAALRAPGAMIVELSLRCWREGCTAPRALEMRRCSRCQRVYYCSSDCQRAYVVFFMLLSPTIPTRHPQRLERTPSPPMPYLVQHCAGIYRPHRRYPASFWFSVNVLVTKPSLPLPHALATKASEFRRSNPMLPTPRRSRSKSWHQTSNRIHRGIRRYLVIHAWAVLGLTCTV